MLLFIYTRDERLDVRMEGIREKDEFQLQNLTSHFPFLTSSVGGNYGK